MCKHTYRQNQWSLPGGYIKTKKHPIEGLVREIKEETGFIVRIEKIIHTKTDRETARLDMACIGTYIGGEFRASREISQVSFFSFENLPLLSQNQLLLVKEVLQDNPKIISDKSESIKQFSVWEKIRNKMNIYPITPINIETQ